MDHRVLMFGWEFPPHNSGGLGAACHGLTKALASAGQPITFVLPRRLRVDATFMRMHFADDPTLPIDMYAVDSILSGYDSSLSYDERLEVEETQRTRYGKTLLAEVLRYAGEASRIATTRDHEIIHAHDWLTFPAGMSAQKATGKPFIAHVHATEFDRTAGQGGNSDVKQIESEALNRADHVITVSDYTRQKVREQYGVDHGRISVVHNGVETGEWQHTDIEDTLWTLKRLGKHIVLFVGRITIQKGPEYFIRAAAEVLKHDPEAVFIVSGDGDMRSRMIEEAAYLGIGDHIFFPGFLRGRELAAAYRASDLYVMPSVSEPFGLTALESIANGAPVLVSKQSGVAEVLPSALKANFWDTEDIAHKIAGVLKDRTLRDALLSGGRKELERLSWDSSAEKCRDLYARMHHTSL